MKYLFLTIFISFSSLVYCQRVEVEFVNGVYLSNIEVPAPYSKESPHNHTYWRYSYFHSITINHELGIGISFSTPMIEFNIGDYPNISFISDAESSGNLLSFYFQYTFNKKLVKNLYLNCNSGLNLSKYYVYFIGGIGILDEKGVNGQQEVKGLTELKSIAGIMILPEISLALKYEFLRYFSIEARLGYVQGTKRIQELKTTYTLHNSEEYYSKNYSLGSNYYPSIGLSFYFGGYPNKKAKIKKEKRRTLRKRRKKIYK